MMNTAHDGRDRPAGAAVAWRLLCIIRAGPWPNRDRPPLTTEIIAGVTTFFTMAYIVVVNPAILSSPGTGMPFSGALTATVLVCFTMTLLMGALRAAAVRRRAGHGPQRVLRLHASIISGGVPWPVALGIVFWAGVLFLLVSATPLRERIAMAIPAVAALGDGGRHRPAADVHRPAERRVRRGQSRRRWSASGRSITARC